MTSRQVKRHLALVLMIISLPFKVAVHYPLLALTVAARFQQRQIHITVLGSRQTTTSINMLDCFVLKTS